MAALSLHLFLGLWSLTQSIGITSHTLGEPGMRGLAACEAIAIGLGYASIPVAVLVGVLDFA